MSLPVISAANGLCARSVRKALDEFGFFFIADHGCDVAGIREVAEGFYSVDTATKRSVRAQASRGWSGLGEEVTNGKRDWHECYDFMQDRAAGLSFAGTNRWPDENSCEALAGFRRKIGSYIAACEALSVEIVEAVAASYDIGAPDVAYVARDPYYIFRLLHYPPFPTEPGENVGIGIGEHTDYGFVTLLTTTAPGLELRLGDEWIPVAPHPSHLLCNIGDAFASWTRNTLRATPHRVRRVTEERLSVAYFFEPNLDTVMRPLFGEATGEEITHGAYLENKYRSSYPDAHPPGGAGEATSIAQ